MAGDDERRGAEGVGRAGEGADVARAGRPVEDDDRTVRPRGVLEPGDAVVGHLDDGDQLGAVLAAAEPGVQLGGEEHPLAVGRRPEVVGPGGRRAVRAQQRPDGPALLDRAGDRADALHEELAAAVPLGAVGQQRLPLLEARVLAGDAEVGASRGGPGGRVVLGRGVVLLAELLARLGREPVAEDGAEGVVGLVLEAAREEPVALEAHRLAVEAGAVDARPVGARARLEGAREGQAALVVGRRAAGPCPRAA